jgi:hypothetical protein
MRPAADGRFEPSAVSHKPSVIPHPPPAGDALWRRDAPSMATMPQEWAADKEIMAIVDYVANRPSMP